MALTSTVLTTTAASVFTSNGENAITAIYLCNTGDTAVQFNMHAVPNGTAADDRNLIYYKVPLASKDTYVIDTEKLILQDLDSLQAKIIDPQSIQNVGLGDTVIPGTSNPGWAQDNVNAVTWAADRSEYIVAGPQGKIAISATAENWVYTTSLTTAGWSNSNQIRAVTKMSGGRYVVVGDGGSVASSVNGTAWTGLSGLNVTPWATNNAYAVTNNGSIFLAAGANGLVATSIDGVSWAVRTGLPSSGWGSSSVWAAIWTGTQFVIGGDGGKIATSVDGVTWTYIPSLATNPAWGTNTRITSLVYSGTSSIGYLALSQDNNKTATCTNLSTWVYNAGLAAIGSSTYPGIGGATYKPGFGFYAIGTSSDIYILDTSGTWSKNNSLTSLPWQAYAGTGLYWNSSRSEFIAIGYQARVATSSDAATWTYRTQVPAVYSNALPNVVVTVSSIGI
jgi:hypothetical protein